MIREFREFINRGNVVEMAVGFVMGLAFKPVVDALVERVLMPAVGVLAGEPNFDRLGTFACEAPAAVADPSAWIDAGDRLCAGSLGAVVTATLNFLLIAWAMFLVVRAYNRLARRAEPTPEEATDPPEEVRLLREIRDRL